MSRASYRRDVLDVVSWWMHGLPRRRVERVIRLWWDSVLSEVAAGREVRVPGVGTFRRGTRAARVVRDPVTRALRQLPETVTVRFVAAKRARERLK